LFWGGGGLGYHILSAGLQTNHFGINDINDCQMKKMQFW